MKLSTNKKLMIGGLVLVGVAIVIYKIHQHQVTKAPTLVRA